MPRKNSGYGGKAYAQAKRRLRGRPCHLRLVCDGAPGTEPDHVPPLSRHRHVDGSGCCVLKAACSACQRRQAVLLANETRMAKASGLVLEFDEEPEPEGFPLESDVWAVPWLDDLRDLPADAVWPRLMTVPHPRAVGSLGVEFEGWCLSHRGITLRWWQRLVARRLLEVDAEGRLVWLVLILTLARQLGKSWLLRLILAWRLHQGDLFGGPQRMLHMSIQMNQVRDVMGPEVDLARTMPELYDVLDNNNDTSITWRADGSSWVRVVRGTSRAGGAYGRSGISVGVVDEAWSIPPAVVDEGLEPTIVEAEQPWLMLVSTAHRLATALMLDRRNNSLDDLALVEDSALLIEWSTPRHFDIEDEDGWRMASPRWTAQRAQLLRGLCRRALSGFASDDPDEPDPVEALRAQWLNQWPARLTPRGKGELLIDIGRWGQLSVEGDEPRRLWVAVADNFGRGAGVAAVAEIGDGRYELDARTVEDREAAFAWARRTLDRAGVPASLVVEPSLATAAPADADHATPADVRFGLPLLRELVESGRLVHDVTPELDQQIGECRVRPVSGGFSLATNVRSDLVRASALAVRAAVVNRPMPAVHAFVPPRV